MTVFTWANALIALEADTKQRVEFQVFPTMITDTKAVNWADVNVIGRSEPLKTFAGSGPRTFNYILTFAASVDAGDAGTPAEVKRKVEFLQSLIYPQTTKHGIVTHPPVCLLLIGDMINARVVAKQIGVKYQGPWEMEQRQERKIEVGAPGDTVNFDSVGVGPLFPTIPLFVDVQVTMDELNIIPDDSAYVRGGRK